MDSSEDLRVQQHQASWQACLALRGAVANNGEINMAAFGHAMFNAGVATSYFKALDLVETLEAKLRDAKSVTKKDKASNV